MTSMVPKVTIGMFCAVMKILIGCSSSQMTFELFPTSGSNEVITPGRLDLLPCLRSVVDAEYLREGELNYLIHSTFQKAVRDSIATADWRQRDGMEG